MSRTPRPASLALAAALLLQLLAGAHYISRTMLDDRAGQTFVLWDDAMISMRFARNLAEGNGLVWNPGEEPVQGFTNLGVTLAMGALHLLPTPPERVAGIVQALALLALMATELLAARIVRDVTRNAWAGAAVAWALVLCAPHQIYALQGADTGFVALLLVAAHAQLIRGWLRTHRWPAAGFVPLLAAAALRPDASLFVVCAAAIVALFPDARGRGRAVPPLLGLAIVWAGLVGLGLAYYGDPLPNTYYLKAVGSPRSLMLASGLEQLGSAALGWAPALALCAAAFAPAPRAASHAAQQGQDRPVLLLLASTLAATAAYHVWVGGDWSREVGSRYLVQVVPSLIVLATVGAVRVGEQISERLGERITPNTTSAGTAVATGLALVAGACASSTTAAREWFIPSTPTLYHAENQGNLARARYLERATRSDARIAVHWAGIGPYFANRESIDVLGRSDRHIAHMQVDRFVAGHSKWDWDYVLEVQKPDLIDFDSRDLRNHPLFRRDYLVLRLGPQTHLFVHRDSLDKLLDPTVQIEPLETVFGSGETTSR